MYPIPLCHHLSPKRLTPSLSYIIFEWPPIRFIDLIVRRRNSPVSVSIMSKNLVNGTIRFIELITRRRLNCLNFFEDFPHFSSEVRLLIIVIQANFFPKIVVFHQLLNLVYILTSAKSLRKILLARNQKSHFLFVDLNKWLHKTNLMWSNASP